MAFAAGIYCSLKALEGSNIETVIVFRSCTPLMVSVLDYFLLNRELPSRRSAMALGLIALGAAGYVLTGWIIILTTATMITGKTSKMIIKTCA